MTIARKLWLGFGVLIVIFLVADLTILLSAATMNRDLTQTVSVEEPARTAAYEMEIKTVEIGRDVRVYSLNGDPRYRENFAKDRAQFEESKARYDEVVDTRKGKELGDRIDALYGEYVSLGDSLMDEKDQQGTVSTGEQEEFLKRQNELGSLLSQEVQPWATQQLSQAEDDANAAVRTVYVTIVSLILVGLIVGMLAASLIYRGIMGSVRALTEGANRIGRGEMDHRIDIDTSDELGAVASAFNDMLDRRREANAALNESEERFRRLSDATFEGVVMSENARIVDANRAFAEMFGYDLPEIVGLSVRELITPESLELVLHNISSDAEETYEAVALRKDGTRFDVEVRGKASSYQGRTVRIAALRDVTERKRAETRLREAEERYRTLVEQVPAVIYVQQVAADRSKGTNPTVYASPQIEEQTGYPPQAFEEDPELSIKLLHPADREWVLAQDVRTDETRESFKVEYRLVRRDGRVVWIRDEAFLVRDEEGSPSYWQGIRLDITDRKAAEEALRESEERYRLVARATNEVIWDNDPATGEQVWDGAIEAMFGYAPDEIGGQASWWEERLHPDDRERVMSVVNTALEEGVETWSIEYRFRRADGTYSTVVDRGYVMRDAAGEPVRLIGSMMDVTERKRAEEDLVEAREAAEAANRAKSEFLATMSHEIRTPMNGVIGMTSLLLDTSLDREQREYTEAIRLSGENLMVIINDILDFSKIEAGAMRMETIEFDLRSSVEDVAALLANRVHDKGIELACLIEPDVPTVLRGDPGRLRQVLTNLIGNAVKFTEEGEEARLAGIEVYLTKPVRQSELYDALATIISATDEAGSQGEAQLVTRHSLRERRTVSRARVLVAEDNPVNQKVAARMLENLGYPVDVVEDGLEALEAFSRTRYGAILMDVQMPEMDGYAATAEIRRREGDARHTPIIAMTANALEGDREKAIEAGMDDYVPKPVKVEELDAVLKRWTSREEESTGGDGLEEPLDEVVLAGLRELGDADLLSELSNMFLDDASSSLAVLREAVKEGDALTVERVAHTLKGAAGSMGAPGMAAICAELQDVGASGYLGVAAELLGWLEKEFGRVRPALEAEAARDS